MTSACQKPRHNAQWWARYWRLKRLASIRRRLWVRAFNEFGSLYGGQWERAEEQLIRLECEEQGLPMGYGRVGRAPRQLTWGMAVAVEAEVEEEDSEDSDMELESDDETPR